MSDTSLRWQLVVAGVLVISGCSAVGKSTVSRLLAASLEPSVHLPTDVFLRLFPDPFPDPWSPAGAHRYAIVGAAVAAAAAQFAVGGYTVILDGPILPDGADGVAEICWRRGVETHYAVLRTDLGTCLARSQLRDPGGPPDLEEFRSLHARFADLAHREDHAVDASQPPEEVAATLRSSFLTGELALSGGNGR